MHASSFTCNQKWTAYKEQEKYSYRKDYENSISKWTQRDGIMQSKIMVSLSLGQGEITSPPRNKFTRLSDLIMPTLT